MRTGNRACKECPFRRTSMAGWLGPWKSAREILEQAFSEAGLACHMQLDQAHEVGGAPVCTGSLICANKSGKLYRDKELQRLQNSLIRKPDEDIMSAVDFLQRHQKRINLVGESRDVGSTEEV